MNKKKYRKTISLISQIRELTNAFIISELEKKGYKGLVPSHGEIMFCLYNHPEKMTMKNISEKIHKTQPTVTVLIDKLIDLDFVKREKSIDDGRITYILLTQKGLEFKKTFFEISEILNKKFHHSISELEADMLEKLLENVIKNFRD